MRIIYKKWACNLEFSTYAANGSLRIDLVADGSQEDLFPGEPIATATVCLPKLPLQPGEVLIKNYSENAGIHKALMDQGVVGPKLLSVGMNFGSAEIIVCKLLINPDEIYNEEAV